MAMRTIDFSGLKCPIPVVRLSKLVKEMTAGEELEVTADDPAFCPDVKAWCVKTGHELVRLDNSRSRCVAVIRKKA